VLPNVPLAVDFVYYLINVHTDIYLDICTTGI
jgi:hypothetical protein